MSNSNQAGKGDKPRPVNKKQFDDNFDRIQWSNKKNVQAKERKGKVTYKY